MTGAPIAMGCLVATRGRSATCSDNLLMKPSAVQGNNEKPLILVECPQGIGHDGALGAAGRAAPKDHRRTN
jgi:hypothetical protein